MSWVIVNKRNGKYLKGTNYTVYPRRQILTTDVPLLFEEYEFARIALKVRRCNKNYKIVKVKIVEVDE